MPGQGSAEKTDGSSERVTRCKSKLNTERFILPVVENPKTKVLENPIQSESDKKKYKVIELVNGLRALLISDTSSDKPTDGKTKAPVSSNDDEADCESVKVESESKMAACAMSVNLGGMHDPPNIKGLAHFVEHMLFMGSEKYPDENNFHAFIKKVGGLDNAFTDFETTTFFFDIEENALSEAMDRLSQFFVAPLMKQEVMQREKEAIQSEFSLGTPSDTNRKLQLLCSILPPDHPCHCFMWGNSISLSAPNGPSDSELHQAAHDFRNRHYSAHRMTVAVQARLPLETLEQYVVSTFGLIPSNNQKSHDSQYVFKPEDLAGDFHSIYYIKPVAQISELVLNWGMKSLKKYYKESPHRFMNKIFTSKGTGSLLSYLKKKVWAFDILTNDSDTEVYNNQFIYFSCTTIKLTQNGLDNIDKVLDAVFGYIKMLKEKLPIEGERLFNEYKSIQELNFKFSQESQPRSNVEKVSGNMLHCPPEHYFTGNNLYYDYSPELINYIVDSMSPETVNIMISSQSHKVPVQYDQTEQWFGTEYKKTEIPAESVSRWKEMIPKPEFHLPEPNIYITDNFDLIPMPETSSGDQNAAEAHHAEDFPKLLKNDDLIETWYKADYKFRRQMTIIYISLESPTMNDIKGTCLLDVWTGVLQYILNEKLYAAGMARLIYIISSTNKGMQLKITGYNQKLPILVDVITKTMKDYKSFVTPEMFIAIKDSYLKTCINSVNSNFNFISDVWMMLLLENHRMSIEKIRTYQDITFEDLQTFGNNFTENMRAQILVQGNLLRQDAIAISDIVQNNLKWKAMTEEERPKIKIFQIPQGEKYCRVNSFNSQDANSIIMNYYQCGVLTIKEAVIIDALVLLMREPLFYQLRTIEQLGYGVDCASTFTFGVLGFVIVLITQADKYSSDHVDSRIEHFLEHFRKSIGELTPEAFESTKSSLIKANQKMDDDLDDEVSRNWGEIKIHEYLFDKNAQKKKAIEELTIEDIRTWVEDHLQFAINKARKLSIQIMGHKKDTDDSSGNAIEGNSATVPDYVLRFVPRDGDSAASGETTQVTAYFENVEDLQKTLQLLPEWRPATPPLDDSE